MEFLIVPKEEEADDYDADIPWPEPKANAPTNIPEMVKEMEGELEFTAKVYGVNYGVLLKSCCYDCDPRKVLFVVFPLSLLSLSSLSSHDNIYIKVDVAVMDKNSELIL